MPSSIMHLHVVVAVYDYFTKLPRRGTCYGIDSTVMPCVERWYAEHVCNCCCFAAVKAG